MEHCVALIEYSHESNTFSRNRTGIDAFRASHLFDGEEMRTHMRGSNSEIGGFLDLADELGWKAAPILAAHAQPGGRVTEEARQQILQGVLHGLAESGPFDGVCIALHGAMVTDTAQDGETQFLKEIRAALGSDIPIAVTLDLHANIFDEMAELVNVAVSYRTYPHVDMAETARLAGQMLDGAMSGDISPKVLVARPAMIVGCDDGRTTRNGPMCRILEEAAEKAQAPGILHVAVNAGFTDADVFAAGPSVMVTYDDKTPSLEVARRAASDICDTIWSYRNEWDRPAKLDDSIAQLKTMSRQAKPVVIADFSDNPGSGAYGDCTALLDALLQSGIENIAFGALFDPAAAAELARAGVGADVSLTIGGKTDPSVGGGPLCVAGTVTAVSNGAFTFEGPLWAGLPGNTGLSVAFRVGGTEVMITSENLQMLDLNMFRSVGIEPAKKSVLAVKSMQHFRGAFEPISSCVIVTDAGGLCTPDVASRTYRNLRRPVFPMELTDD